MTSDLQEELAGNPVAMFTFGVWLALGALFTPTFQQQSARVDLGYQVHEGYLNASTSLYKFSNIRYAQPPVGELRFAAPVSPEGRSSKVENGSVPVLCPQANPYWGYIAQQFTQYVVAGNASEFNFTAAQEQLEALLANPPKLEVDPATTEDCLFLDVVIPQSILEKAVEHDRKQHRWTDERAGAPVVIWIYGGGYTAGSKDWFDPSGLIKASQSNGGDGIVYVALNYRVGALGFLSGATVQESGGVANAGLHDQRLAIEWVKDNIHLFGGDPEQVTIMGQSAGGGSVALQIAAYGGQKPVPFQRAISQSPGLAADRNEEGHEAAAQGFFRLLNVTSLEEARQLDSAAIIAANALQIGLSPYGTAIYNVVVDGDFVPDTPSVLFTNGQFATDVQVMVGHTSNEAPFFSPPFVQDDESLRAFIAESFPGIPVEWVDQLLSFYPAVYDGTYPYRSGLERTFLIVAEWIFTCPTNLINKAFDNQTYAYEFQVPPALHGQDIGYTFYNSQGNDLKIGLLAAIAEIQQAYITNFIQTGDPNGPGLYPWPMQGGNASINTWNITGVRIEKDSTVSDRCSFWQVSGAA